MPNLARTQPRPPVAMPKARTKVLLVRQPVKSVRKSDEPDRAMYNLILGAIVALGIVGAVWLMGYLGFRMGFAPLVRVPELSIDGGGGILTGTAPAAVASPSVSKTRAIASTSAAVTVSSIAIVTWFRLT